MKPSIRTTLIAAVISLSVILYLAAVMYNDWSQIAMETPSSSSLKSFNPQCLPLLNQSKIFFAHMSVGYNILDGVKTLLQDNSAAIPIAETDDPSQMFAPGLYHARLGFNGDPAAKIRSFESQLAKIASANPDIVMMKLCYVDINHGRNAGDLIHLYRQTIDQLQQKYPRIRFVHCTVPLTSEPPTLKHKIKSVIKSLLGKSTWAQDNATRMDFNNLLRQHYPTDSIFDIAMAECRTPENRLCYVPCGRIQAPVLYRAYTDDGGHLNKIGQRYAAEQFLMALSGAISIPPSKP